MSRLKMPFAPMEAATAAEIPVGVEWQYEPKWDGFRCLAFRRGKKIELQSKSGKSVSRLSTIDSRAAVFGMVRNSFAGAPTRPHVNVNWTRFSKLAQRRSTFLARRWDSGVDGTGLRTPNRLLQVCL